MRDAITTAETMIVYKSARTQFYVKGVEVTPKEFSTWLGGLEEQLATTNAEIKRLRVVLSKIRHNAYTLDEAVDMASAALEQGRERE